MPDKRFPNPVARDTKHRCAFNHDLGVWTAHFLVSDWRNRTHLPANAGWQWHIPALLALVAAVPVPPMPSWVHLAACHVSMSLLRIRTHFDHRMHDLPCQPGVFVENLDFPELFFLRNNPHVFQHARPTVPWHEIPKLCCADRERFQGAIERYLFRSQGEVFCRYFLACKDSAARPLLHGRLRDDPETTDG